MSTLPTGSADLLPVTEFHGGIVSPGSLPAPTLRPNARTVSYSLYRYATVWCDACGRKRLDDGRCPMCDPWWTSGFYVYGSFLIVIATALIYGLALAIRAECAVPTDDVGRYAAVQRHTLLPGVVMSAPTYSNGHSFTASMSSYAPRPGVAYVGSVRPQIVGVSFPRRPVVSLPATASAPSISPTMDANRLRAMTDYVDGVETHREAARALAPSHLNVTIMPGVNAAPPPAVFPPMAEREPSPPTGAPNENIDNAARDAAAARML